MNKIDLSQARPSTKIEVNPSVKLDDSNEVSEAMADSGSVHIDQLSGLANSAEKAALNRLIRHRSPHLLYEADRSNAALSGSVLDTLAKSVSGLSSMAQETWGNSSDSTKNTLKTVGALGAGALAAKSLLSARSLFPGRSTDVNITGLPSSSTGEEQNVVPSSSHLRDRDWDSVPSTDSEDVLRLPVNFYQSAADLGARYYERADDEAIESLAGDPIIAASDEEMVLHAKYPKTFLTSDGRLLPTQAAFNALQGGWFKKLRKKIKKGVKKATKWVKTKAAPVLSKVTAGLSKVAKFVPGIGALAAPVLNAASKGLKFVSKLGDKASAVVGADDNVGKARPIPAAVVNHGVRSTPRAPIAKQVPMAPVATVAPTSEPAQTSQVAVNPSGDSKAVVGKASAMSLMVDDPQDLSHKQTPDEQDVIEAELQVIGDEELAGWAFLAPLLTKGAVAALKWVALPAIVEKGVSAFTKSASGKGIAPESETLSEFSSKSSAALSNTGKAAPVVDGVATQAALSVGPRWYSKLLTFAKKASGSATGLAKKYGGKALSLLFKTKKGRTALAVGALVSTGLLRAKSDEKKEAFLKLVDSGLEGSEEYDEWMPLRQKISKGIDLSESEQAHASDLAAIAYAGSLAAVEEGEGTAEDEALVETYRSSVRSLEAIDPVTASRIQKLSEDMADSMDEGDLDASLHATPGDSEKATESSDSVETPSDAVAALDPAQSTMLNAAIMEGQSVDKIMKLVGTFGLSAGAIALLTPMISSAISSYREKKARKAAAGEEGIDVPLF